MSVPHDAVRTEPYFLRRPRLGARYQWAPAEAARTLPFAAPDVRAAVEVRMHGIVFPVTRAAEFVAIDKALGELRRPLLVVPAASLAVEPRVTILPLGQAAARTITVTVRAARDSLHGTLRLVAPTGWNVTPAAVAVEMARAGESRNVAFTVTAPAAGAASATLRAQLDAHGITYHDGYTLIDYPHIRPHALYTPAAVRVSRFDVAIPTDLRIGYIEGAGDDGALALRQLGAHVEPLDAAALAAADLARFDAIVAGIRAYEVRPDLIAHNARVLEYVRAGGTFVVQYNKYELVDLGLMPWPATIARPHGRVTDEHASVTLLEPAHPALAAPNRITAADFDGWLHERGLYYLDTVDPRYTTLLAMADPGEAPQRGSLVVARVGRGWYVYTGLALFRQWPEGVPGAYRLLANLVSLGRPAITP